MFLQGPAEFLMMISGPLSGPWHLPLLYSSLLYVTWNARLWCILLLEFLVFSSRRLGYTYQTPHPIPLQWKKRGSPPQRWKFSSGTLFCLWPSRYTTYLLFIVNQTNLNVEILTCHRVYIGAQPSLKSRLSLPNTNHRRQYPNSSSRIWFSPVEVRIVFILRPSSSPDYSGLP